MQTVTPVIKLTDEQIQANNDFLDLMIEKLRLKNDAALSRILEQAPPVISKIRHGRLGIGDSLTVRCHEVSDMPIREIKARLGKPSLKNKRK